MVACMAEEMSDPSRTIPRSLIGGLFLVTVLLVFTNMAYFVVLDLDGVMASEATAVTFARATWGVAGVYLVPVIVCVCTFGTMSSSFLSHSRLLMAAARKRHLPWAFSLITMNSSLPIVAIASRCCSAILFAVTGSVDLLVKGGMTVLSLMTIMVMLAKLRLRVTMKDADRPISVPTWLVFVDIAISLTVALVPVLAATQVSQYAIALGCVLAGFPAYVALKAVQRSKFGTSMNRFLQRLMLSVPCVPS
ncbi:Y+L amino acid transporter 2-like [Dermacentor variabilis]|uniref:Y+L amino acid transporter 2-like n=1 Tax=Dermacentor variabilis TaxID=34621 RepID=UPI003F5C676D